MIGKTRFINEVIRVACEHGYKIEANARTGQVQIDFGNKKLHYAHLDGIYPSAIEPNAKISSLIEQVAPGRPCSHKPMRKIIEQLRAEGRL